MRTHELKIWPEFFEAVLRGDKTFEIRENDRDYQEGDILVLREYDAYKGKYTGRSLTVKVTYLLGSPWVKLGDVCLAIRPVEDTPPTDSEVAELEHENDILAERVRECPDCGYDLKSGLRDSLECSNCGYSGIPGINAPEKEREDAK